MPALNHANQPVEQWRDGVQTRMRVSALVAAAQLCIFEQWCLPGTGAPSHYHAVEEALTVLAGEAQVWLGEQQLRLTADQSVVVPAGRSHGFVNVGAGTLHVLAILAAPIFEAAYADAHETPRRWRPT